MNQLFTNNYFCFVLFCLPYFHKRHHLRPSLPDWPGAWAEQLLELPWWGFDETIEETWWHAQDPHGLPHDVTNLLHHLQAENIEWLLSGMVYLPVSFLSHSSRRDSQSPNLPELCSTPFRISSVCVHHRLYLGCTLLSPWLTKCILFFEGQHLDTSSVKPSPMCHPVVMAGALLQTSRERCLYRIQCNHIWPFTLDHRC